MKTQRKFKDSLRNVSEFFKKVIEIKGYIKESKGFLIQVKEFRGILKDRGCQWIPGERPRSKKTKKIWEVLAKVRVSLERRIDFGSKNSENQSIP